MTKRPANGLKRLASVTLGVMLSVGLLAETALASTTLVTTGTVNFRTGPSTSQSIIRKVSPGETATLLSKYNSSWYKVDLKGKTGYLSSKYVTTQSTPKTSSYDLYRTTGSVNFRTGPSTSNSVIQKLSQGSVVEYISTYNSSWYKVSYNGKIGYLSPKYITPYLTNTSAPPSKPATQGTYVVTGSVNFRTGPSTSNSVIRKLSIDQTVELVSIYNSSWYKVIHNGTTGYLSPRYISSAAPSTGTTPAPSVPSYKAATLTYKGSTISWYNSFSYDLMKQNPTTHVSKMSTLLDQRKAVLIGPSFSATDGYSNYLAGHNPGILSPLAKMKIGDTFTATDKNGKATSYVVTSTATGTTTTCAAKTIGPNQKKVFDYYFSGVAEECIVIQFCTGATSIATHYAVPVK